MDQDHREPHCIGCGEEVGPGNATWLIRYHPDQPVDDVATSVSLKRSDDGERITYLALEHAAAGLAQVLTLNRCATLSLYRALGEALAIWGKTEPEPAELGRPTGHPEDRRE